MARPDSAQLTGGGDISMAVLANDNDPDGDALALLGIDAPGHGTIRVEAGQTIRYTPQRGFSGIDSFTHTVGDGRGGVSMATVTVAVVNPNTPPVAAADVASTVAGTPVTIDVL
ncbi:MAG TPA: Ig-like domain-containing protein, partial [Geminicoccaceae bacterium]|nr:Ig-like domain-containing protein [Geminicoccaceae bacterium]